MAFGQRFSRSKYLDDGVVIYAVGDIHGRADLLRTALRKIQSDARSAGSQPIAVFLGDYVDRGPESANVLQILSSDPLPGIDTRFLKGNHDAYLLDFLKGRVSGAEWLNYGGAETLVAYGVKPPSGLGTAAAWEGARQELAARMPEAHRGFLSALELTACYGRYLFVHAGVRPGRSLKAQEERDLLEIREPFLSAKARYKYFVVHGHTPAPRAYRDHRRLCLDTGAFATGVLTLARLEGNEIRLFSTRPRTT